jgi:uncharacterized protein
LFILATLAGLYGLLSQNPTTEPQPASASDDLYAENPALPKPTPLLNGQENDAGYAGFTPLKAEHGAVSWDIFGGVRSIPRQTVDADGLQRYWISPKFTPAMRALNGKKVLLHGYMFPLEPAEKQRTFLFGPYPPSCPYHYHVNNNQVVEVLAKKPLSFGEKPIVIEGTLTLIEQDDNGTFYRLLDAVLMKK